MNCRCILEIHETFWPLHECCTRQIGRFHAENVAEWSITIQPPTTLFTQIWDQESCWKPNSENQILRFLSGQPVSLMMAQLMPATADGNIKDRNADSLPADELDDVGAHISFLSHSWPDYLPLTHLANQITIMTSSWQQFNLCFFHSYKMLKLGPPCIPTNTLSGSHLQQRWLTIIHHMNWFNSWTSSYRMEDREKRPPEHLGTHTQVQRKRLGPRVCAQT